VSGRLWALRYHEAQRRVVENRPIPSRDLPVLSFGEDEQGEVYFLTTTVNGQGILMTTASLVQPLRRNRSARPQDTASLGFNASFRSLLQGLHSQAPPS
jgi:hypothetical protein